MLKPGSALYRSDRLKYIALDTSNGLEDLQIYLACLRSGGYFLIMPDFFVQASFA